MDKKNLIAFLSLSLAVLLLSNILLPAPAPVKPKDDKPAPANPATKDASTGAAATADIPQLQVGDDTANGAATPEVAELPLEFATLGSLDPQTGNRMLVTFTNRGAAVRRAELSSPRFLDLTDRAGYLGQLEFENTPQGLKVGVVGAGTPAAVAGIAAGDIISSVQHENGKSVTVKTDEEFEKVRRLSRPGHTLVLGIARDGQPQQLTVKLVRKPLAVMRPEIENIKMRDGVVPTGFVDPASFLTSLASVSGREIPANAAAQLAAYGAAGSDINDAKGKDLATAARINDWFSAGNWQIVDRTETSITFERPISELALKLVKRYTLQPVPEGSREDINFPGYNLSLDVEVHNTGDTPQTVAYRLDGPTGLPIEGWWYTHKISQRWFSAAGLRDVVVRFQGAATTQIDCATIAQDKAEPMGQGKSLAFVGVDAVYFSAVFVPVKKSLDEDWFDSTEAIRIGPAPIVRDTPLRFTNVSCRMTRKPIELAPGASQKDSYVIFVGPKRPELLAQYKAADDPNYSLRDIIYYGMWPFSAVARGMLSLLHFFYSIVGNFGIAIIMLTVLVRGAMFPVSFKQTQSMARMQALKPELDRINEKYKSDMQKRSQAMQEVYRKHKVNPLSGCLPVLLQLPIFIGLYRSIMVDVELRQRPLFSEAIRWCSDLSAPDMLYNWSWFMPKMVNSGEGIFGLGPYFNVLPIVTVILFLVSMKMSMPEPTNEQAVMQQKMMKYMTGFMGLLFYKVASGLCLYFIASSLWGLGERRLLKKAKEGDNAGDGALIAKPATAPARVQPSSNGAGGNSGKDTKEKRKR